MTQQFSDPNAPGSQRSTPDVARHEAADVARTVADKGGEVASSVGGQASRVASETKEQARNLLHEGREQLTGQARQGQQRAADGLHTLADQLRQMTEKADDQGVATEVARQVADRTRSVATWLEQRDPGDLINEVRQFARRKPGMFLLGAALAGVAVGRLTRGAIAANSNDSGSSSASGTGAPIPRQPAAQTSPRHANPQTAAMPQPYPRTTPPQPTAMSPQPTAMPPYPTTAAEGPAYPAPPVPQGTPNWDPERGPVTR